MKHYETFSGHEKINMFLNFIRTDVRKCVGGGVCTFFFMARPLLLASLLLLSMEAALRRGDFPFFPPSGFSIHQELFPVPSFWMRTKRLCSDRLCLMEFCAVRKTNAQMNCGHARMDSKVTTATRVRSFLMTLGCMSICFSMIGAKIFWGHS